MAEQQGMFGPSAEELQRALMAQQQAADFEQARQFGMMNLGQQISTGAYGGGLGITRGLEMAGRGLGLIPEDPRVMQAQKMEQIKQGLMQSGVDPRNIDQFYPEMIMQLQRAGMMDKAFELEKQYQAISAKKAEAALRESQIRNQAETAAAQAAQRMSVVAKAEAEQRAAQGRAAFIMRKNPELSQEEAAGLAFDPAAFNKFMETPKTQTDVVTVNGRKILINKQDGSTIKDLGPAGPGLGEGLTALAAAVGGKAEAEASGKATAAAAADIQNRYDALSSLQEAKKTLNQGIYAGFYGPAMEFVAATTAGAVGDKTRLENTQKFRSYIGEVVIPRLKDFGGSDTVEELKYLRDVLAGNTKLEPKAISAILDAADRKIRNRIQRIKDQQESVRTGAQLPTGPSRTRTITRTLPSGITVQEEVSE